MSEPTVDAGTRGAILEALAAKAAAKSAKVEKKAIDPNAEVDETTSFEELLERSLDKRDEVNEEEAKAADDIRDRVINESQIDLVGDLMKRLL